MACQRTRYPLLPMMFVCTLKTINLTGIHKLQMIKGLRCCAVCSHAALLRNALCKHVSG